MEHLSRAAGVSHANYKIAYKTDRECHHGGEMANFRDLVWAADFHTNFRAPTDAAAWLLGIRHSTCSADELTGYCVIVSHISMRYCFHTILHQLDVFKHWALGGVLEIVLEIASDASWKWWCEL